MKREGLLIFRLRCNYLFGQITYNFVIRSNYIKTCHTNDVAFVNTKFRNCMKR
ncbi:hypothetical protein QWZ13_15720 [Reinekea marina]|uniref:hypothetical protein n=1 Tax=Reinekea marina TaxID=1310421 RepID=UPI0025B2A686|nr:hypothetical protein [Reinekea marina]MDN3650355.1 hypothetical protein [Reinekea marina]